MVDEQDISLKAFSVDLDVSNEHGCDQRGPKKTPSPSSVVHCEGGYNLGSKAVRWGAEPPLHLTT